MNIQELYQQLKPQIARDFRPTTTVNNISSGGSGGGATAFSQLSGTASNAQIPQALLKDGSRSLTGNMLVDAGVTIDGVDLSVHVADPDAHHARSHGLMSTADHFVTGLTAGQVLKATGATTWTFATIAHTELSSVLPDQHHAQAHNILGTDHTYTGGAALDVFGLTATSTIGKLTPSSNPGSTGAILRSASDGSLTLGTSMFILDNTAQTLGFGVTPDGAASYDFKALATADHTVRIKQLASQTGRLWRVEDTGGNELLVLDSVGNLQSGNPGFVSGLTGWQITPTGNAEFNNAFIRGELHASIFVMDEFHASGGTLFVATAGKLENPWTINLTTGSELVVDLRTTSVTGIGSQLDIRTTSVTGSGTQLTTRNITNYVDITDPPSGHAMIFSAGQTLRLKSIGQISPGIDLYDIWCKVLYVEDQTAYYRYYVQIWSGGAHGAVIPAGVADISYGRNGDGRILLTSDLNYAPYMDVFTVGESPWLGEVTPHVRIGRLDGVGVPGVSGVLQYGMVAGTNLSDANSAYFVMSNVKQRMYRIDSEWNNATNPTVMISSDGRFKIGYNTNNANQTVFDFNPTLGTLDIGSASYPFAVSVYGDINIQAGSSGYGNLSDKPTSLSSINSGEGTKLNAGLDASGNLITKVLPGSNVGTPAGAGLYLGADKLGYYSGGAWTLYMDSTGKMGLGGTSGARLAWDGTDLYGTDGTTVQWYARASTGKMYAGAGAVVLDPNGITLTNDTSNSYLTQAEKNAVTFNRSAVGTIGRVTSYYLSGTSAYGLDAYAMSPNSELVTTRLRAIAQANVYGGTAPGAPTVLLASGASDYAKIYAAIIQLFATSNATPSIEVVANQVRIYDDLRLDGSTNHALGIRTTA